MEARTKGSILVASAIVALIGSGAAVSGGGGGDEQWRKALEARSEVLNEQYELGAYAPVTGGPMATSEPAWVRALRLRSEALNRQHGLGESDFRTSPAPLGDEPTWLRALRLRSEALNQRYKLGEHSPRSQALLTTSDGPPVQGGPSHATRSSDIPARSRTPPGSYPQRPWPRNGTPQSLTTSWSP